MNTGRPADPDIGGDQSRVSRVLLVEDDRSDARLITRLVSQGFGETIPVEVSHASSIEAAVAFSGVRFDIILSDLNLPDSAGTSTLSRLVALFPGVPVVAMTADEAAGRESIRVGAQDFIPKPELAVRTLQTKIEFAIERSRRLGQVEFMSTHDPLTHLLNRWSFTAQAEERIALAKQHEYGVALLVADVDDFKGINDTFGHEQGDLVLVDVASVLRSIVRGEDPLARWGGDEFCFLSLLQTAHAYEQLMQRINSAIWPAVLNCGLSSVRVSFGGYHTFDPDAMILDSLVRQADSQMYQNKNAHRGIAE